MRIELNGRVEEVKQAEKLIDLLIAKNLHDRKGLVVMVNGVIIEKEKFGEFSINDGDKVEIFSFVQGG